MRAKEANDPLKARIKNLEHQSGLAFSKGCRMNRPRRIHRAGPLRAKRKGRSRRPRRSYWYLRAPGLPVGDAKNSPGTQNRIIRFIVP